jgi:hypothetical protein
MGDYGSVRGSLPKGSHKGRQMVHHHQTGKYAKQRIRTEKNKAAARKNHLALHPNDLQAVKNVHKALAKFD